MNVTYRINDSGQLVLAVGTELTIKDMTMPKKGKVLNESLVMEVLAVGTGFVGGKRRIREIIESNLSLTDKATKVKAEYGTGGCSWGTVYKTKRSGNWVDGKYAIGYSTIGSKGLTIDYIENKEQYSYTYSWNAIVKVLENMIASGDYAA